MSWLWGGIIGACGAVFLARTMLRLASRALAQSGIFLPAAAIFLFDIGWAFLFSPIGALRLAYPVALGLLLAAGSGGNTQAERRPYPLGRSYGQ